MFIMWQSFDVGMAEIRKQVNPLKDGKGAWTVNSLQLIFLSANFSNFKLIWRV